jgi:hypothetical protein
MFYQRHTPARAGMAYQNISRIIVLPSGQLFCNS